MGCTTAQIDEEAIKIVKLDYRQVNTYIDRIPLVVIQKIKEKFDNYSNDQAELLFEQFHILYTPYLKHTSTHPSSFTHRLYLYYNDLNLKGLKFRNFISKYATINYCEEDIFASIVFFLAGSSLMEEAPLTDEEYQKFAQANSQFFSFKAEKYGSETIDQEQFKKRLKQSGFLWQEYRKRFLLMEKEDLPFEAIGRGLIDMDINDFEIGQQYYILSSSWFERWSYYYQGSEDQTFSRTKSTKLLIKKKSFQRKRSYRKQASNREISIDGSSSIIERPTLISFEDIEGEFFGELKENIRIHYECKIVSKQLWELFKKTMPPEYEIKRVANSISSLDLYPKNVYFLKTDSSGEILPQSFKNILMPIKKTLQDIDKDGEKSEKPEKFYFFTKNLGDNLWSEEDSDTMLGKCSTETRFFVVKTQSKIGFIEKYFRKKKEQSIITYGDKVYSYFSFNRKVIPAYIINLPTKKSAIIHYCGFNYRYEIEVPLDSLSMESNNIEESIKNPMKSVKTATQNFSFKGIRNIGNTCFINTIIQCLIATPVMGSYLNQSNFNQETQPLLYEVSLLAKDLLMNKKVSPVELKKTIDVNLEIFSGNNQHDAQQFLNFLLDKFSEEIMPPNKSKSNKDIRPSSEQTIVDHLFSGIVQSKITCKDCGYEKKIDERALIVSLPIPEPQFNIYSIYCFPIYDKKIRRVILRLHRTCRLKDYVKGFQDRLGVNCEDYIFVEVHSGMTKKIRQDFYQTHKQNPLLSQLNFNSNVQIHAFEKLRDRDLNIIKDENRSHFKDKHSKYFDYHNTDQAKWVFSRLVEITGNRTTLELLDQDASLSFMKLKEYPDTDIKPLGQKIHQKVFKKLINRRFNSSLQKMEPFGVHYMVSYYKEISYKQLQDLVDIVMKNFIQPGVKIAPYRIKINQSNKGKCLFCEKVEGKTTDKSAIYEKNEKKAWQCCKLTEEQMTTPLIWIAKEKMYTVFIDWEDLDSYSTSFASVAEIDPMSSAAEKAQNEDKIHVEDCLNLLQQPENVEIECDKCKYKEAKKLQLLKEAPNILVLHMKQFRYTADHNLIKMDVNIKWIEYLDISKYSLSQSGSLYELFAYVCHTGTSSSGHYTSVVKRKHPFENKKVWVSFDDDVTNILEQQQSNIDSAYLLFFKKVDMPNSSYINFNVMKELDSLAKSKESKELSK